MKAGQKSIIRWVAKLVAKEPRRLTHKSVSGLRELDTEQLRHVGGGTDTPTKTW